MQKCLDPETDVNKIFENVFMSGAYSKKFSRKGHQFSSLFKRSFFRQIQSNLAQVTKTTLGGSGGMLYR